MMRIPVSFLLVMVALILAGRSSAQEIIAQDFHANGRLKSTRFHDGSQERFLSYYESGRLRETGAFKDGRRHGVWKMFDENGAVLARAEFINGQRQGVWEFRDPLNRLRVRLRYEYGALSHGEQYGDQGEVVAQRRY